MHRLSLNSLAGPAQEESETRRASLKLVAFAESTTCNTIPSAASGHGTGCDAPVAILMRRRTHACDISASSTSSTSGWVPVPQGAMHTLVLEVLCDPELGLRKQAKRHKPSLTYHLMFASCRQHGLVSSCRNVKDDVPSVRAPAGQKGRSHQACSSTGKPHKPLSGQPDSVCLIAGWRCWLDSLCTLFGCWPWHGLQVCCSSHPMFY